MATIHRSTCPFSSDSTPHCHMARRWRRDPAFETMRPGLADPREFVHTVVTLTVASYLRDVGNALYLYDAPGRGKGSRSPGWTSALGHLRSPRSRLLEGLFRPPDCFVGRSARQLIERQARSAGIRTGGQLDPRRPGLLILGGWHVSNEDIDTLAARGRTAHVRLRWLGEPAWDRHRGHRPGG